MHLSSFYGDFAGTQFLLKSGAEPLALDKKRSK